MKRIAALPAWVIDGNYTDTIGSRFAAADAVIYLDVPSWLCMTRLLRRMFVNYGRVRADAAQGCAERLNLGFLRFSWSWNRVRRKRTLAMVEGFPGTQVILRTKTDRKRLLAGQP